MGLKPSPSGDTSVFPSLGEFSNNSFVFPNKALLFDVIFKEPQTKNVHRVQRTSVRTHQPTGFSRWWFTALAVKYSLHRDSFA
jgi:hypothetical protein